MAVHFAGASVRPLPPRLRTRCILPAGAIAYKGVPRPTARCPVGRVTNPTACPAVG